MGLKKHVKSRICVTTRVHHLPPKSKYYWLASDLIQTVLMVTCQYVYSVPMSSLLTLKAKTMETFLPFKSFALC